MRAAVWLLFLWVMCLCPSGAEAHHKDKNQASTERRTLRIEGFERSYLIHVPRGITHRVPVVMMLHGRGGTSDSAANDFGWVEKADQEGFLAVFPQALPIDPARPSGTKLPENFMQHWKVPTNDSFWWTHGMAKSYPYLANPHYPRLLHPLDTPFLLAVMRDVFRHCSVNPHRVYVAGFSSGGEMASDFAQSAAMELAAVAVAGSVGWSRPHQLREPVSAFLAIGTDDEFGQPGQAVWDSMSATAKDKWFGRQSPPTLEQDVALWAQLDGCQDHTLTRTSWGQEIRWSECLKGVQVRGFSINELGHEWPGSKPSQWNQAHSAQIPLHLTDVIWDFFRSLD